MNTIKRDRQFRPLPVPSVDIRGLFGDRQDAICDTTAETLLDRCVEAGMISAIDTRKPSPGIVIPIQAWGGTTQMFWDSDLGKSIETVAYSLYRRNDSLTATLEVLWDDLTTKQMYVTGGIGPAAANEGFTDYYDLPNESAYAETCASVGLVFWANRMLGRGPNRRYADIMEQALYNGAMSGLSLDGKTFFYENPLESAGKHHRWVWHHCPCCPPNIARLLASIGSYMYAVSEDEIAVHLYGESTARFDIGGARIELTQQTQYPWAGAIHFDVTTDRAASFAVSLRIPAWADGSTLKVNGEAWNLDGTMIDGYARIERDWKNGDHIDLEIPLAPRALFANPLVHQDAGRAALMRGPMVYCVEATDNGSGLNRIKLAGVLSNATTTELHELRGAVALEVPVTRDQADWGNALYRTSPPRTEETTARFVPYPFWDNRTPGEMLVWVRARTER
jgi:DUF1680 family protein